MESKAANQSQPKRAQRKQPDRQCVEMARSEPHQLDTGGVVACRVLDDERRQCAEIAGRCIRCPAHDRMRVASKLSEQFAEQMRPRYPAVMRPQYPTQPL